MTDRLSLPTRYRRMVEALLRQHVPEAEVWVYGSRIQGRSHDGSDLDLVIRSPLLAPLGAELLDLIEAFQESNIPFLVQVHDWARLPGSFHREIERDYVVVQKRSRQATVSEWRTAPWGELATLEYGKSLRDYNTSTGMYKVYGTNGPIGRHSEPLCPYASVVIGRKGAYRGVHYSPDPFFVIDTAFYLKPKVDLDTRWAYYQLRTQNINGLDSGSAIPSTSRQDFYGLTAKVPPLPEQRAIARVLGALDDKIELNRRMNETLEEMAQALFKSWFVDFDPVRAKMEGRWRRGESLPGLPADLYDLFPDRLVDSELGEIPEGWGVKELGGLVRTIKGRSYRSVDLRDSETALVTLKSFARGGGYRTEGLKPYVGTFNLEQVISPGEIVIACTDVTQAAEVIGRPAIVQQSSIYKTLVASLDTLIVRLKPEAMSPAFLYLLACTPQFTSHTYAHTTGTTVLHLIRSAVPSFKLVVPDAQILKAFDVVATPVFTRINRIWQELHFLAAQRDALLPKLVSGEVGVAGVKGSSVPER